MGTRSRTTFKKRQKELARIEKQRDKAARRVQRKLDKQNPAPEDEVQSGDAEDMGPESPESPESPETHSA